MIGGRKRRTRKVVKSRHNSIKRVRKTYRRKRGSKRGGVKTQTSKTSNRKGQPVITLASTSLRSSQKRDSEMFKSERNLDTRQSPLRQQLVRELLKEEKKKEEKDSIEAFENFKTKFMEKYNEKVKKSNLKGDQYDDYGPEDEYITEKELPFPSEWPGLDWMRIVKKKIQLDD